MNAFDFSSVGDCVQETGFSQAFPDGLTRVPDCLCHGSPFLCLSGWLWFCTKEEAPGPVLKEKSPDKVGAGNGSGKMMRCNRSRICWNSRHHYSLTGCRVTLAKTE